MSASKRKKCAYKIGLACAEMLVGTMSDPKNRGPNFEWSGLPEWAENMGAVYCPISLPGWDGLTETEKGRLKAISARAAFCYAQQAKEPT